MLNVKISCFKKEILKLKTAVFHIPLKVDSSSRNTSFSISQKVQGIGTCLTPTTYCLIKFKILLLLSFSTTDAEEGIVAILLKFYFTQTDCCFSNKSVALHFYTKEKFAIPKSTIKSNYQKNIRFFLVNQFFSTFFVDIIALRLFWFAKKPKISGKTMCVEV